MNQISTLNVIFGRIDLIKNRDCVGSGLSGSVFGSGEDVSTRLGNRDGGLLNG